MRHPLPLRRSVRAALLCATAGLAWSQPSLAQNYSHVELGTYAPAVPDPSHGEGGPLQGDPTALGANGDVLGVALVRSGTTFDYERFKFVPAYKRVVLRWPGTVTGLVTPVALSSTVIPLYANSAGNWAGYIPASTLGQRGDRGTQFGRDKAAVQIGSKATVLSYGLTGRNFEVRGINGKNWVLGTAFVESFTSTIYIKGVVWKNGSFTELEHRGAGYTYPVAINDNGDVVGRLQTNELYTSGPLKGTLKQIHQQATLWVNNKVAWQGPENSEALSVNAAGDVLWRTLNPEEGWRYYLRSQGVDQPVPMAGRLSSRKTIVGCLWDGITSKHAVWREGSVIDLDQGMQSQGVPLPVPDRACGDTSSVVDVDQAGRRLLTRRIDLGTTRPSSGRYFRIDGLP